jgi:hypothetical protein
MLKPNPRRFFRFTCGGKYTDKNLDRYSSYVDTSPGLGPKGDCWEWKASTDNYGYGHFSITKNGKQINIKAHRMAVEAFTNHLIPVGKCVMHKCDNPKCVKILTHLILGTTLDNSNDKINKNRQPDLSGEMSGHAKLTWNQVREIRRLYNTGKYTYKMLGKIFTINAIHIGLIVNNKKWYDSNYSRINFKKWERRGKIK